MPHTTVSQLASRVTARKTLEEIKKACWEDAGYVCRVDVWFELLWYAYQPDSGVSATAFTREEALSSIVHQFAAYMECEPQDIKVTAA